MVPQYYGSNSFSAWTVYTLLCILMIICICNGVLNDLVLNYYWSFVTKWIQTCSWSSHEWKIIQNIMQGVLDYKPLQTFQKLIRCFNRLPWKCVSYCNEILLSHCSAAAVTTWVLLICLSTDMYAIFFGVW